MIEPPSGIQEIKSISNTPSTTINPSLIAIFSIEIKVMKASSKKDMHPKAEGSINN
jgi:hypothetical protein